MSRQAFERESNIEEFLNPAVFLDQLTQTRFLLLCIPESDLFTSRIRNQLGNRVDFSIGHAHATTDIADNCTGHHRTKSDNLRNFLITVLFADIIDDILATIDTEVDVDIRHRDTFRIQKALKKQIIRDRVDVGDLEGIGDQATSGTTTSGTYRDIVVFRPVNEIGDDQEVVRKTHLVDDLQLFLKASLVGFNILCGEFRMQLADIRKTLLQPLI